MNADKLLGVDPYWILVINGLKSNWLLLLITLMVVTLISAASFTQAKFRKLLPPGPPGWPIVGNLLQLGPLPHRTLAGLCRQYGPLVYLKIGSVHCVTTDSPQMIKELLCKQDEAFASRPRTAAGKLMGYDDVDVALAPYGAHWKLMRRVCMEHLLTTRRIESFQQHRLEEAEAMVASVMGKCKQGNVLNMRELLGSFTMNIVTGMLLGKRYFGAESMGAEEAKYFRELIHATMALHGVFFVGDYLPFFKWVDFQGLQRLFTRIGQKKDDYYSSIIREHREKREKLKQSDLNSDEAQDFVDVMLKMSGEGKLNDREMKALLDDIVAGGTDTASYTLEWCMAELIRNPKTMQKAQEELDQLLKDGHTLQESDLPQLKYLKAIVKETFRLHPVGGFLIQHQSTRETTVSGYLIPKHSLVLINSHGLGRNADVWENPLQFKPERFLQDEKVELRDAEFRIVPFGSGKRKCPGAHLGKLMVLLGLGRLIHGFNWLPPPPLKPHEIDVMEANGMTTPPATPLKAIATPRVQSHRY